MFLDADRSRCFCPAFGSLALKTRPHCLAVTRATTNNYPPCQSSKHNTHTTNNHRQWWINYNDIIRRKFRSQTSDNMDRWKRRVGRVRDEKSTREKIREEKERVRRKKTQVREKVGKSRNTVFFQWFVAPEGRKVGSLKRRVRSPAGQMRDEKLHAVVARSTFRSQNEQNAPFSEHFWMLRWWTSARRCGAKHISK